MKQFAINYQGRTWQGGPGGHISDFADVYRDIKKKATNSPIHKFKVLHKGQRAFQTLLLMVYDFLYTTLKNI